MSDSSSANPPQRAQPTGELPRQIAHALRTPLGLIMSALQELSAATESPLLTLGNRGAQQIRRLADRLGLLGRLEQGERQRSDPLDLTALMQQAVDEIAKTRPRRKVTVRTGAAPPRAQILGSADHLVAAIAEIVDNAVRLAKTSVDLSIREQDEYLQVEVRDDGPGMPSAEAPMNGLGNGGLGIGLHLVRAITARHDGHFELKTHKDGGAQALLSLRRVED